MAHAYWDEVQRVRDLGVQVGDYLKVEPTFRGLGDLAGKKSRGQLQALINDSATAVKIKARADRELNTIAQQATQIADALSAAQQALSVAQDLAAQVDDPSSLRLVERVEKAVADLEGLAATVDEAYATLNAQVPTGPPELQGIPDDVPNVAAWITFGQALDKAKSGISSVKGKASSLVAQARSAAKQIQTVYDRAVAKATQEEQRELQRQAAEQARENARIAREQAIENARLNAQLALEQQSYMAQQQALAPAPSYTPPPAGYQYAAAPVQPAYDPYYAGGAGAPQQYAQVRYADEPASWGYAQPGQVFQPAAMQVPQAQYGQALPPGWTSAEFAALQQGEGNYLWGLKGVRALGDTATYTRRTPSAPTAGATGIRAGTARPGTSSGGNWGTVDVQGGLTQADHDEYDARLTAATAKVSAKAAGGAPAASDSWLPSSRDVSDAVTTALTVAKDLLPEFLRPPEPAAPPPEPSIVPQVLAATAVVGAVGVGAYALSKAMSGGRSSPRRAPARRRGRR